MPGEAGVSRQALRVNSGGSNEIEKEPAGASVEMPIRSEENKSEIK